jgi:lysophospholipase L1-like esterase
VAGLGAVMLGGLGSLGACGGGGMRAEVEPSKLEARPVAPTGSVVGEPVILDGTGSVVPSTGTVIYSWSVTAPDGTAVALGDGSTARAYFYPAAAGSYQVKLTVSAIAAGLAASSPVASVSMDVVTLATPTAAEVRARIRSLAAAAVPPLAPDSSSPTLTIGTADGVSTLNPGRDLAWYRPEFIYTGSLGTAGFVYPDNLFGNNRTVSYSATLRSSNYLAVDFITDAATFEVFQKGTGYNSQLRVLVDGRLASATAQQLPNDGGTYLTQVRFASAATRRIRLLMNNPHFGGIRVGPNDSVSRPAPGTRLRAMFFGDSITEGPAGQDYPSSYAPRSAELLGWNDVWVSGVGSTGYLAAPSPRLTLRQRLTADVATFQPAVLVVSAGAYDTSFSDAQVQTEAALLFNDIQSGLPSAQVFVTGPLVNTNRARSGINAAVKAAVGSRSNFTWVPNVDDLWLTGTGTVAMPTGNGNSDLYLSSDGTNPSAAGIEYLAGKLAAFIKQAVQ